MRKETEAQRQNRLRLQREWYARNKETVKKHKADYYIKNKEVISEKCRNYKRKSKIVTPLVLSNEKAQIKMPISKRLEVLRKNKTHYLNKKDFCNWNEKDLIEFNKLL